MKANPQSTSLALILALGALASQANGQVLYFQNFDVDDTANWTVNKLGVGQSDANFYFDYSSAGIPSAPHSVDGTTIGLRLRANMLGTTNNFPGGVSVSPIGKTFAGEYQLRYDVWMNFNGPAPGGGSGSTQMTGAGIRTAGTTSQVAGGTVDSAFFGASAEGGTSSDYRAYAPAAQSSYQDASGVYAAGSRNNSNPYYAGFGGVSAPADQVALFPQQTGTTAVGAAGWAWHDSIIKFKGNTITWTLDGLLIATVDATAAGTFGGGNILFNQYDINAGASTDANAPFLLFGLIDNVRVSAVPEPGLAAFGMIGIAALLFRRRS